MNGRLFSYKLKTDAGFAPNPFFGYMTLAACKPLIRKTKDVGDWLAGFTSKSLCGDEVGSERLIFLMQITDKITFAEFFNNNKYKLKIPDNNKQEFIFRAGDNIYKPNGEGYIQIANCNHFEKNIKKDLSCKSVLVSDNYYYFGSNAISIPDDIRPDVPQGQSAAGSKTRDEYRKEKFIEFVQNNREVGVYGKPHKWPSDDNSWSKK